MKVLNASLMAAPPENGFTLQMRNIAGDGYWTLPPNNTDFNQQLIQLTSQHQIDLIFLQIQTPAIVDLLALRQCKNMGAVIFNYNGDVRHNLPDWMVDVAPEISASLFSNMRDVRSMRDLGYAADWLELGFDELKYRKHENPLPAPEIVAHFNQYGNGYFPLSEYRSQIVHELTVEFGDRFGVFGNFPGFAKGNFNSDQVMESRNYAGAKIAINCSHFGIEKYSSDRLSRITGTGGAMCLSHTFPALSELYEVRNHLDVFNDIPELIRKCHYYLKPSQEELRLKIAASGQEHALKHYTFKKMCSNIVELFEKYKYGK